MSDAGVSYQRCLSRLPPPGGGGAHQALFGAGCHGARAGVSQEQVCADIRAHLPRGSREVSEREIEEGVRAGFAEVAGGTAKPRRPAPRVAPGTFARFVREGLGTTEEDIIKKSPTPLDFPEWEAGWRAIKTLYQTHEMLFVGEAKQAGRLAETIRPAGEWADVLRRAGRVAFPMIAVNPLTGRPGPKRSGGVSLRADSCVAVRRFAVAEMDGAPVAHQLAFWRTVPHLPVSAIVMSGRHSVHAWLRVDAADDVEWRQGVRDGLFACFLEPMGFDASCKNDSRMSRMPGHVRVNTGKVQRLLYLCPEGKAVCE